jgi:hypothetical protein
VLSIARVGHGPYDLRIARHASRQTVRSPLKLRRDELQARIVQALMDDGLFQVP